MVEHRNIKKFETWVKYFMYGWQKITVKIIQEFSLAAPQHPKKATMQIIDPIMIIKIGADHNASP